MGMHICSLGLPKQGLQYDVEIDRGAKSCSCSSANR